MNRSISDNCSTRRSGCNNSEGDGLDLTILGSPAPRAPRVARSSQRRPLQPPNSPTRSFNLPIDQIMHLRAELNERLEEGCGFISDRTSSRASSHPELALDLSSIADSFSGSGVSSATSSCDESEWSPVRSYQHRTSTTQYSQYSSSYAQSKTIPQKLKGKINQSNYMSFRADPSDIGSCHSRCSCRTNNIEKNTDRQLKGRSADLIQVYVDTVNNTQLSKFFRPCAICDKQCCECSRFEKLRSCGLQESDNSLNEICKTCEVQYCACFPFISNGRDSLRGQSPHTSELSHSVTHSRVKNIGEQAVDSGNSTLQLDDSSREAMADIEQISERLREDVGPSRVGNRSGIISRDHVSLSVMQLSTAAQCARILADSLESVLQLARDEIDEDSQRTSLKGSGLRTDSLKSALQSLTDKNTK